MSSITSSNLFLLFGQHRAHTAPVVMLNDTWGVVGDSITYGNMRPKMYAYWLGIAMSGVGQFTPTTGAGTNGAIGSNLGVSGQDTTDIAARVANITASGLDVYFLMSWENDDSGVLASTMIANWETILNGLTSAKRVYLIGSGETRSVASNSTVRARNAVVNAWMATANSTYPNARYIPDTAAWNNIALHDGAGGAGADSYDGTHPNLQGAKKLGENIWNYIRSEWESGTVYNIGYSNNYFPTDFSGTTGSKSNATGDVATGMDLTNTTGATVVASKGTLYGSTSQVLTISGTATANNVIRLREYGSGAFQIGDTITMCGKIKVTASDGVSAPVGLRAIEANAWYGKGLFLSRSHVPADDGEWVPFSGTFRVQPDKTTTAGTSFTTDLDVYPQTSTALDIRVEYADVRIYNETIEEG